MMFDRGPLMFCVEEGDHRNGGFSLGVTAFRIPRRVL